MSRPALLSCWRRTRTPRKAPLLLLQPLKQQDQNQRTCKKKKLRKKKQETNTSIINKVLYSKTLQAPPPIIYPRWSRPAPERWTGGWNRSQTLWSQVTRGKNCWKEMLESTETYDAVTDRTKEPKQTQAKPMWNYQRKTFGEQFDQVQQLLKAIGERAATENDMIRWVRCLCVEWRATAFCPGQDSDIHLGSHSKRNCMHF